MGCPKLPYYHRFLCKEKFSTSLKVVYNKKLGEEKGCKSKHQWDYIHNPQTMLFVWAQDEEEGAIIDYHAITKLTGEDLPVQSGAASFFTPAGLPIHFADMSKMEEMHFTIDKVDDCFDGELKPTDCQSGENHIIADKGVLIAFRYNGAFYTPIIRISDESYPGTIKASDNFFVGYKAKNYYSEEYTPEKESSEVYWYQGEPNETISFCFEKDNYINASTFNKEEYKGAGYFATYMERRTRYSCDNYLMTLKELDNLDFFNSTLSAQYNPWGDEGLLQSIEDREGKYRLVYSVENDNGSKEHYEYDHALEDWVSIDIASASASDYMKLDFISEIAGLYGHQTLDILGFIPFAGEAIDLVNGMWYLVEGDGGNATLCFASMLPVVGDAAVKSSKYAIKIIKGRKLQKLFDLTDESLAAYGRIAKTLQQGGEVTCRECLELSGKLLAHNPGKAAAIEKLATRITDSDQLKAVLNKVDEMGTTQKGKFLDDMQQMEDVAVFDGSMVDAWKVIENHPILRKKPENLESISKWVDEGIEPQKLTDGVAKSNSKQNLIDELGTAQSKLHAQVLIKDYDNIPGVAKGRYHSNSSTMADKVDLPSGWSSNIDLDADVVSTFTGKVEPLELKPGDKIYRVSDGSRGGGVYWTRTKPKGLEDVVGGTAVRPEWNNFEYLYEYTVPDGVSIKTWKGNAAKQKVSEVSSNYHLPGGDEQLFIPFIKDQDPNFVDKVIKTKAQW